MEATVSLEWGAPQGSGPDVIVDYYNVSTSPRPPYQLASFLVSSQYQNATIILEHNEVYTIDITAINCAGESGQAVPLSVEYGKCFKMIVTCDQQHYYISKLW